MRSRYIYEKGEVVYAEVGGTVQFDRRERHNDAGFYVIKDCEPFKSMIDGSIINSKSTYRDHLREHNCIEVGNDKSIMNPVRKPLESPPGLKQELIRQVYEKLR